MCQSCMAVEKVEVLCHVKFDVQSQSIPLASTTFLVLKDGAECMYSNRLILVMEKISCRLVLWHVNYTVLLHFPWVCHLQEFITRGAEV